MVQSKYIAACYCRLSKDDAADGTSVSIETQQKILADYCNSNGFSVFDFYCDDGYTGTNFQRPNFRRMMMDVESGKVNAVVVKDLSRFGRNYIEVGKYIEDVFPEHGVRFIAIGDSVDTEQDNIDLDLMLPMKNIFNQFYPADCSRKTRQAFHAKALRGEFIGTNAAYGYRKSAEDKHVLEVDEVTAPIVQRIFRMIAYENCGCNKIARTLRREKILTPTAYTAKRSGRSYAKDPYDWNLATVQKMIQNQVYLGHTINGKKKKVSFKSKRVIMQPEEKWIVVKDTHEPIISEQLFHDANEQLKSRKRKCKNSEPHLFSGIAKCADCGYAMSHTPKKNGSDFLCCTNYKQRGKDVCEVHYIRFDDLYQIVFADVKRQIEAVRTNEAKVEKLLKERNCQMKQADLKRAQREMQSAEMRIKELDERFYKIYEDKLDGLLSEERFKEISKRFEDEQSDLKAKLERLRIQVSVKEESSHNVDLFIEEIKQFFDMTELNKEILHRLVNKIIVGNKYEVDGQKRQDVTIEYKFIGEGV